MAMGKRLMASISNNTLHHYLYLYIVANKLNYQRVLVAWAFELTVALEVSVSNFNPPYNFLRSFSTLLFTDSSPLFYILIKLLYVAYRISHILTKLYMSHLQINNCVFNFASEFRQNNARALRFWCVKCTNLKGECIGQASKLKRKCIILSKFSSTK